MRGKGYESLIFYFCKYCICLLLKRNLENTHNLNFLNLEFFFFLFDKKINMREPNRQCTT